MTTSLSARLLGAVLALSLPAPAAAQGLLDLFMPPQEEQRIGAEQHPKILEEFGGAYPDRRVAAYVDSIGQFLARTAGAADTRFTFTVLNSPVVNAFALPGGYVYVTRGLLALAGDEAELAGVLAHEIGHVAARHGAERYSKNVLTGLGLAILGAVTDSPLATNLAQFGALAVLRGHSREDELEADSLGIQYMSRAGFAPPAMSSFLRKLEAHGALQAALHGQSRGSGFDFFSTHPRTADRLARALEAAGKHPVTDPIVARDIYLDKIDGILFGDDPEQGVIEGRRFIHPVLGFEFNVPPRFSLLNGSDSVVARGPQGATIRFDAGRRQEHLPVAIYLQRVWAPNVELRELQELWINGMPAATALARAGRGRERQVDVRLLAIAFDYQTVYRFLFVTPPRATAALEPEFQRTAFSFRRLARREAAAVRPRRLSIYRVGAAETLQAVSARMAVPDHHRQRFLVLNGLSEEARLTPGQRVKLVVQ